MLVLLRVVKAGPEYIIQKSPLFIVLLLMSMLERLSAFAADVAIERDYVPQLAGVVWLISFYELLLRAYIHPSSNL